MEKKDLELISSWAEEFCNEHELYLVRVENAGPKITVYADGLVNITIEQCTRLSRFLQTKLEEETTILDIYTLDVSSPGMTNPLILPIQYQKRLNKNLDIVTTEGVALTGKIIDVNEQGISLEITIPKNKKTKEEEKISTQQYTYNQIKKATIPLPTITKKK
jgi:ribosome maturation factor RimP